MRVDGIEKGISLDARGKFGYSGGFGLIAFGYTRFGFYTWLAGIYQKKYFHGKSAIVRQRFSWGKNNQTPDQQAWRAVMASGVSAWQALSSDDKKSFNFRAKNLIMSGYNLFLREWLNSHI